MSDVRQLQKRFENDPVFYAMTKCIYEQLTSAALTPSEVREAAMLACVKFEMIHTRVLGIPVHNPGPDAGEMKYEIRRLNPEGKLEVDQDDWLTYKPTGVAKENHRE